MDPFLISLNRQIESVAEGPERAMLVARRAIHSARIGRFDDSTGDVIWLRSIYGEGRYPQVSILTILAEGVRYYFENLSDRAQERIDRAYALAHAMQSRECLPLVGSWLAHLDFEACRYHRAVSLISDHFASAEESDPSALVRFCLVLADAFLYTGDRFGSQYWYSRARVLACTLGDRATLGAIMYNRAAFGLCSARALKHMGGPEFNSFDPTLLRAEAWASLHYQELTEVRALSHLSVATLARAHVLCEDYIAALAILEPLASDIHLKEKRSKQTSVMGELALCLLETGRVGEAAHLLGTYTPEDNNHLDLDDQVALIHEMRRIADSLNDRSAFARLDSVASEVGMAYLSNLNELRLLLTPWRPGSGAGNLP